MLRVVRVSGPSMTPTLEHGDFVVVLGAFRAHRIGDVVAVNHPRYGRIVKRIVARDPRGRLGLTGDGPLSTSREDLGWIEPRDVLGRVCMRVPAIAG